MKRMLGLSVSQRPRSPGAWAASALACWACCCGGAGTARAQQLELRAGKLSVGFGRDGHCAVVSLKTREGAELAAAKSPRLFTLTCSRQAQLPGEKVTLASGDAAEFQAARQDADGASRVTLTYGGFSNGVAQVVCTARVLPGEPMVRWRIAVQMREGWVLESVLYPAVTLAAPLGTSVDDDAAVLGASKGGVLRRPGAMKPGSGVSIGQPGNMAAQFGCYYDDRAGFYTAAEDGLGYPKDLLFSRTGSGVEFGWHRH